MKTIKNILLLTAMVMCTINSFSQSRAIGRMSVTIVSPASMSSIEDVNLGNVSFSSNNTKSSFTASSRNYKNAGGLEILNEGNVSLASFRVSGNGAAYSITLPEEPVVTNNKDNNMKVSGFKTIRTASSIQNDYSENIEVGAIVQVKDNNAHGLYTSETPMRITVNYN